MILRILLKIMEAPPDDNVSNENKSMKNPVGITSNGIFQSIYLQMSPKTLLSTKIFGLSGAGDPIIG